MNAHSTLPIDRSAERTHLFLVATLSFGRASTTVRVRNLSATGALVESADVPPTGTQIVLRRGALEAFGSVVWAGSGKAGLVFREPLAVSGWLPEKGPKRHALVDPIPAEASHQASATVGDRPSGGDGALSTPGLVLELSTLQARLARLGGELMLDSALVAKHPDVDLLVAAERQIARIIVALLAARG